MIEIFAIALVVGTVALAPDLSSMWTPALRRAVYRARRLRTDGSRVVAGDSTLEAEQRRMAALKAEPALWTFAGVEPTRGKTPAHAAALGVTTPLQGKSYERASGHC